MTKPFVLFDLGETLVDLKELLVSLAAKITAKYPAFREDTGAIIRRWIVESSRAMPRTPGQAFVPEFTVASRVMAGLLRERGIGVDEGSAGRILREGWDDFESRVCFMGGVTEAWLKEIRSLSSGLAIVTDGDRENVDRLFRRLPLAPYCDVVVTSEDVHSYKPNPPIYEAALRAMGAPAGQSIFVSDSAQDLQGASALGMATCLFGRQVVDASRDLPKGTIRMSDPRELVSVLRGFAATRRFRLEKRT